MKYYNRVHNELRPIDIQKKLDNVVYPLAHILHLGYDPIINENRKKSERSFPLIEKMIEENPNNIKNYLIWME